MKNWLKYSILPAAWTLYVLLWWLLHPHLGYMLDSDAVAYLTIARRICEGAYLQSVNGLWSPLNVWMIVPLMKAGMEAFMAAKVLNLFIGAVVLGQVHFLFRRFRLAPFVRALMMVCSSVVMVYFAYFQLFGDVLQLVFVLAYLMLLWSPRFFTHKLYPVLAGLLMALAFYAKAYSLMFFFLHFSVMLWMAIRHRLVNIRGAGRMAMLGFGTAILCVLPWSYALHQKYGEWSVTGFAGKLNMSWYINSGKSFRSDIRLLIPPAYDDSPSFWEDPYLSQENLSSPLTSVKHFVRWTARCVHTSLVALGCFQEISFFSLALLLIAFWYFFFRQNGQEDAPLLFEFRTLWITMILLPLGYLMMHIETRYIWLNTFLLMVLAAGLWDRMCHMWNKQLQTLTILLLVFSFIAFPVLQFERLKGKNKSLFDMAAALKEKQFKGKFTANASDAGSMWVIAYLTGSSFYTIERSDYTAGELAAEMRRYQVPYYFYVSENNVWAQMAIDSQFKPLFKAGGVQVFELR